MCFMYILIVKRVRKSRQKMKLTFKKGVHKYGMLFIISHLSSTGSSYSPLLGSGTEGNNFL